MSAPARVRDNHCLRLTAQNRIAGYVATKAHTTDQGVLVTPDVGKLTFAEGVKLLVDHHVAHGRDTKKLEGRIALHLTPYFGERRRMATITSATVTAYRAHRNQQTPKPALATVNRELAWLKQMFTLAVDAGLLMTKPKIKLPAEHNARQGFFEHEQYESMMRHLPEDLRPVVRFAYITGWRVKSEVLTLEWRHVD